MGSCLSEHCRGVSSHKERFLSAYPGIGISVLHSDNYSWVSQRSKMPSRETSQHFLHLSPFPPIPYLSTPSPIPPPKCWDWPLGSLLSSSRRLAAPLPPRWPGETHRVRWHSRGGETTQSPELRELLPPFSHLGVRASAPENSAHRYLSGEASCFSHSSWLSLGSGSLTGLFARPQLPVRWAYQEDQGLGAAGSLRPAALALCQIHLDTGLVLVHSSK